MERVLRSKKQARKNYNIMSRWYDLFTRSEKEFADIGIQLLDVQVNESILEIGCGTGHALIKFTNKSQNVCAIDLSEQMLKVARAKIKHASIMFCQADGLVLPFSTDQFDCVFISFALELFDTPEVPKVLQEISRVLKENGRLGIVSLVKEETTAVRIYEWFHRLLPTLVDCRPIYLRPAMKEAGLQIQESTIKTMWGLPVEIAIGKKWSSGGVSK